MTLLDKSRLFQTSILGGLLLAAAPVYAQDAQPADEPEQTTAADEEDEEFFEEEGDTIVVTGSRLRRNEFTSASPLQVIDGELARDLGLVDAADLLGQTTVVQGQQTTTGVSTSAGLVTDNGPGSATASLRGLSADRTLVLINGRRLAPAGVRGVPSVPDLNMIPGTLIERVDVLLDGASSIYGSDAVAGVVNYNLRNDFDGIQLDVFATLPELPGNAGHQEVYTLTTGVSNDRGFIGFAVEHSESAGYNESALSDFYSPYGGGCRSSVTLGASGTIYNPDRCVGSFGAGAVSSPFGFLAYDLGARIPGLPNDFSPVPITGGLIQPDNVGGQRLLLFPEELNAAFAPDFERNTIYTLGEYDTGFYGDMTAYFEMSYGERRTKTNTRGQGRIRLPSDYVLGAFGGGSTSSLYYGNTFINETNVAQTRLIGGLKGDLPFLDNDFMSNWAYDAYVSYSRSSGQDAVQGIPYLPRLEQTLANTRIDPATGQAVCDDRVISGEGQRVECRPLNFLEPTFLFTGRFADPEDTAYLFPNRLTDTIVEQTVYSGFISGDLFDIPTGDTIILGVGAEYRDDAIRTNTSLSGDFLGFTSDPGSNGSRSLTEFFGEIELPLVKDYPLVNELSVNLAGRYTDESNFGAEETYSVKGLYSPTDWLTFRGTYGTSYRAPNLGEQFGGRVEGFVPAGFNDPCETPGIAVPFVDHDNDPSTPNIRLYNPALENRAQIILDNCTNGGGPFGLPGTDITTLGIRGLGTPNPVFLGNNARQASGSNPNLNPETSNAFSAGVTFEQPWIDDIDLRVAVTWYEIEIDQEINQLTSNTIVNRCYNSVGLTDPTCGFFNRSPRVAGDDESGRVTFVNAINQNLGKQTSEGIDYNVEFGFDVEPGFLDAPVDYRLIARATQSLRQDIEETTITGIIINDQLNEYGNPEWRLNLTNVFSYKDFSLLWQSRFIDSMIEDNIVANRNEAVTSGFSNCVQAGDGPCTQFDDLASYWVHNMSFALNRDTYIVRLGVNNVFNDAPPLTQNNELRNLGGIGYDIGGRTYFANLTKRF